MSAVNVGVIESGLELTMSNESLMTTNKLYITLNTDVVYLKYNLVGRTAAINKHYSLKKDKARHVRTKNLTRDYYYSVSCCSCPWFSILARYSWLSWLSPGGGCIMNVGLGKPKAESHFWAKRNYSFLFSSTTSLYVVFAGSREIV